VLLVDAEGDGAPLGERLAELAERVAVFGKARSEDEMPERRPLPRGGPNKRRGRSGHPLQV